MTRPTAWPDWFAAAGLDDPRVHRGPRFEQFSMIAQAAVAGIGIALVPRFLIEEELGSGARNPVERPLLSPAPIMSSIGGEGGFSLVRAFTWLRTGRPRLSGIACNA